VMTQRRVAANVHVVNFQNAVLETVRLKVAVHRGVVANGKHVGINHLRESAAKHYALTNANANYAQEDGEKNCSFKALQETVRLLRPCSDVYLQFGSCVACVFARFTLTLFSLRARLIVEQQQANIRAITLQLRKPGPSSPPKKGMT